MHTVHTFASALLALHFLPAGCHGWVVGLPHTTPPLQFYAGLHGSNVYGCPLPVLRIVLFYLILFYLTLRTATLKFRDDITRHASRWFS